MYNFQKWWNLTKFILKNLIPALIELSFSRVKHLGKPNLPNRTWKFELLLILMNRSPMQYRTSMSVNVKMLRNQLDKYAASPSKKHLRVNTYFVPNSALQVVELQPVKLTKEDTFILYFHGGGFCMGSIKSHGVMAGRIATQIGASSFVYNYRLSPESPYPAALQDSLQVYEWLQITKGENSKFIFIGDSAGGNLALSTTLYIRDNCPEKLPHCLVLLSPWSDLSSNTLSWYNNFQYDFLPHPSKMKQWAGYYTPKEMESIDSRLSPFYNTDWSNLPPILIQSGESEQLIDDNIKLVDKMRASKCVDVTFQVYKGMPHVFHAFHKILPMALVAMKDIGEFVNLKLGTVEEIKTHHITKSKL